MIFKQLITGLLLSCVINWLLIILCYTGFFLCVSVFKVKYSSSFKVVFLSSQQESYLIHLCSVFLGGDQSKSDTRRTPPCPCFTPQEVCV